MNSKARYTPYHPKWYRRQVSVWWWLENWASAKFVLRELSGLFCAIFSAVCLWQLRALSQGPEAYAHFLERMRSPGFLLLHSVTVVFVLFHAITWFNLAPKAMILRIRGRRLPDGLVAGLNYLGWLIASAAVAWIYLRG